MNKDTWQGLGCLIVFVLLITTCTYFSSREGQAKHERKELDADSIAKRRQHVKDSIDSVQIEIEKKTIVLLFKGDSTYHYDTQCSKIGSFNDLSFSFEFEAKESGKTLCDECEEIYGVYCSWYAGDLNQVDDEPSYVEPSYDGYDY